MNDFPNMNENPLLTDITVEGSFMEDPFKLDDLNLMPLQPDLTVITKQLENLTIDGNTQFLQLKIERMKRRQLRSSLKTLEQTVQRPCTDAFSLRQELIAMQEHQNSINYQLEGDITALRALTFRCLTRMYQVMTRFLSQMVFMPDDDFEMTQLMSEIAQTFQQLHSYHIPSYI